MSRTEHHMGTLSPLDMSKGLEETAREICESNGWEPFEYDCEKQTYEETLLDNGYYEYAIINGVIYAVDDCELEEDIFVATKMEDGTYQYIVSYYNGGRSFSEAIERALEGNVNGIGRG